MTIEEQARHAVLEALLNGAPLPGGAQPLQFPDSPRLTRSAEVLLVIAKDDPLPDLPARVQVITSEGLADVRQRGEPTPVLEFLEPEHFSGRVGVRLRVSHLDEQGQLLPLGEVIVTFSPTGDNGLTVTEPTYVLAI